MSVNVDPDCQPGPVRPAARRYRVRDLPKGERQFLHAWRRLTLHQKVRCMTYFAEKIGRESELLRRESVRRFDEDLRRNLQINARPAPSRSVPEREQKPPP